LIPHRSKGRLRLPIGLIRLPLPCSRKAPARTRKVRPWPDYPHGRADGSALRGERRFADLHSVPTREAGRPTREPPAACRGTEELLQLNGSTEPRLLGNEAEGYASGAPGRRTLPEPPPLVQQPDARMAAVERPPRRDRHRADLLALRPRPPDRRSPTTRSAGRDARRPLPFRRGETFVTRYRIAEAIERTRDAQLVNRTRPISRCRGPRRDGRRPRRVRGRRASFARLPIAPSQTRSVFARGTAGSTMSRGPAAAA